MNAQDVWLTLTDYDRLAEYVPNLTQSKVKPSDDGKIKLWQEGAQKIVGFDFRASVEMFMDEHFGTSFCRGVFVFCFVFSSWVLETVELDVNVRVHFVSICSRQLRSVDCFLSLFLCFTSSCVWLYVDLGTLTLFLSDGVRVRLPAEAHESAVP